MNILKRLTHRVRSRVELIRVRMTLRGITDFEAIGRLAGLSLFPITVFLCGGWLTGYSNQRIRDALGGSYRIDEKQMVGKSFGADYRHDDSQDVFATPASTPRVQKR